jgi:hypothetical protein
MPLRVALIVIKNHRVRTRITSDVASMPFSQQGRNGARGK